ncbi:MAG: hypothetical protein DI597_03620 [Pseudoxanthomonas spadix]|nr:MAG: hypothetical protein DI597_03620 [Pseudoxanthomonas spadix]
MTAQVEWGTVVQTVPEALSTHEFRALLAACQAHQHFEVLELRVVSSPVLYAGIVVEVGDGTVAPQNSFGILPKERLFIAFMPGCEMPIEVRALRADFPEVLHLNAASPGEPASICLYESWSFESRRWTAERHLNQILWWLSATADGSIHGQDQALEQLFYGSPDVVVLPSHWGEPGGETNLQALYLSCSEMHGHRRYWLGQESPTSQSMPWQVVWMEVPPVDHVPMARSPTTLGDLEQLFVSIGSAFLPQLMSALQDQTRADERKEATNLSLMLMIRIPRVRGDGVERYDWRAYVFAVTWEEVGVSIGALGRADKGAKAFAVVTLGSAATDDTWKKLKICPLEVLQVPTPARARYLSGIDAGDFRGVLAGAGALGSALANLWARSQWGTWDVVDPDQVAPHNIIRHQALAQHIGQKKAVLVRNMNAQVLDRPVQAEAFFGSASDMENEPLVLRMRESALMVDATTTISVPRDWSEHQLPRAASVFLTPSGQSSVLLLEDHGQSLRLSALEAQYYRAVLREDWGGSHLNSSAQARVGAGCRDHSVVLSHEWVQLHAAQLSLALRQGISSDAARIEVRMVDAANGGVSVASIPTYEVRSKQFDAWTVRWDEGLEDLIHDLRAAALPLETGGILLGVIDQTLRTVTLVDAGSAPKDSQSSTTSFVRGKLDVEVHLARVSSVTKDMVCYVGEWHSHPDGVPARPSAIDQKLLATLGLRMSQDGLPATILIAGQHGIEVCFSVWTESEQ